jgi:hypothetical protein
VDDVPFGPACEVPSFSFVIWYCPKSKGLRDWLSPVSIGVGRADNSCYFSLGLLVWFDMSGQGSWVYLGSQSQANFACWGPWHWLWVVFTRGDLGHGYQDFLLKPDGQLEQIVRKHAQRGRFMARPESGMGVSYLYHTPVLRNETEASICVLRMFKLHVWQQYSEQIQYLN